MKRKYPLWLWPNLLSLDAPVIALIWQEMFAQIAHVHLAPRHRWILFLVTWTIYAFDRILDSLATHPEQEQARHSFARDYRLHLLIACCISLLAILWIILFHLKTQLIISGAIGAFVMGFYFLFVHFRKICFVAFNSPPPPKNSPSFLFKKELVVALVFAGGVALAPIILATHIHFHLFIAYVLFALMAFVNCVLITKWESRSFPKLTPFLIPICIKLCIIGIIFTIVLGNPLSYFSGSIASSAILFTVLDYFAENISTECLRVLADAALLTPLPILLFQILT